MPKLLMIVMGAVLFLTPASPASAQTVKTPLQAAFDRLSERVVNEVTDETEHRRMEEFLACVSNRVAIAPKGAQNDATKLEDMIGACAAAFGESLPAGTQGGGGGLIEIGRKTDSTPGYVCTSGRGDPRIADDDGVNLFKLADAAAKKAAEARERAANYEKIAKEAEAKGQALKAAAYKELKDLADKGAAMYDEHAKKLRDLAVNDVLRKVAPGTNDGGTAPFPNSHPDPGAEATPCAAAADLAAKIGECERRSWRGGVCEILAAQLHHCSDPMVTDPAPDAPTCAEQRMGAETDADAILKAYLAECESVVRYGPDGDSPCTGSVGTGQPGYDIHKAFPQTCQSPDGGQSLCVTIDVCSNEKAMPTDDAEACFGTVSFLAIAPTLAEVLATAVDRLGGPVWTPPGGGTGPGGPQPGPEQGV